MNAVVLVGVGFAGDHELPAVDPLRSEGAHRGHEAPELGHELGVVPQVHLRIREYLLHEVDAAEEPIGHFLVERKDPPAHRLQARLGDVRDERQVTKAEELRGPFERVDVAVEGVQVILSDRRDAVAREQRRYPGKDLLSFPEKLAERFVRVRRIAVHAISFCAKPRAFRMRAKMFLIDIVFGALVGRFSLRIFRLKRDIRRRSLSRA